MLRRPERAAARAAARPVLERSPIPVRAHLWPGDDRAAQVILLDPTMVPMPDTIHEWGRQLAAQGITTMRTGALPPRHAAQAEAAGMRCIQELALLEARPPFHAAVARGRGESARSTPAHLEGRGGELDFQDMAAVDLAAFGELWQLDARMLRDVCAATPAFRARVVRAPRSRFPRVHRTPPVAFLLSGRAGRVGYIQRLAVHPDHHRRGIAAALMADALTWMGRWRAERALVNTHVENRAALALYRGLGFTDMPERLRVYEGPTEP